MIQYHSGFFVVTGWRADEKAAPHVDLYRLDAKGITCLCSFVERPNRQLHRTRASGACARRSHGPVN